MTHDVVLRQGWLSQMPSDFQAKVLERCRPQAFAAGESVFRIDDPPGGMFGIVSGGLATVCAFNHQPSGSGDRGL